MGIELKIVADSVADLNEQLAAMLAGAVVVDLKTTEDGDKIEAPAAEKPARKPRTPKASAEGNAASTATSADDSGGAAASPTVTTNTSASEPEPTIEYADVQKAVASLAAAKGRDAVMDVYAEFGVDHATKLKPEQWVDVIAELDKRKAA